MNREVITYPGLSTTLIRLLYFTLTQNSTDSMYTCIPPWRWSKQQPLTPSLLVDRESLNSSHSTTGHSLVWGVGGDVIPPRHPGRGQVPYTRLHDKIKTRLFLFIPHTEGSSRKGVGSRLVSPEVPRSRPTFLGLRDLVGGRWSEGWFLFAWPNTVPTLYLEVTRF